MPRSHGCRDVPEDLGDDVEVRRGLGVVALQDRFDVAPPKKQGDETDQEQELTPPDLELCKHYESLRLNPTREKKNTQGI